MKNDLQGPDPDWFGLYANSSQDTALFTPASVAHPAKMAPLLTLRIIQQMQAWGWLKAGDTVADPFGGRGTSAVYWLALHPANRAVTIELEPHFIQMQRANKAHAERRLNRALPWVILRGDSRYADALLTGDLASTRAMVKSERDELARVWREEDWRAVSFQPFADYARAVGKEHVLEAWEDVPACGGIVVTSPPYASTDVALKNGKSARQLESLRRAVEEGRVSGRESLRVVKAGFNAHTNLANEGDGVGYGPSPANLGNLKDTEAVIASPPYESAVHGHNGIDLAKSQRPGKTTQAKAQGYDAVVTSPPYADAISATSHGIDWAKTGPATGNRKRGQGTKCEETLRAQLNYAAPDACLTSPPYADSLASDDPDRRGGLFRDPKRRRDRTMNAGYSVVTSPPYADSLHANGSSPAANGVGRRDGKPRGKTATEDYGASTSQIGATQGEDYATACGRVYRALARAGVRYLAIVVKNPTRNGKLRRLDKLTARLLRQAGYRIRAWRRSHLYETQAQVDQRHGQASLFEDAGPSTRLVGRVSFFKRLHLQKGGVAAQWEDCFFAELADGAGAAIMSPPYGASRAAPSELAFAEITGNLHRKPRHLSPSETDGEYGTSPAQIGNLKDD